MSRPGATGQPEEYPLHKAISSKYVVRARQARNGSSLVFPLTLRIDMCTRFGRDNEECRSSMVRLKNSAETITVGQIKF